VTPAELLELLAAGEVDAPENRGCYLGSIHSAKGEEWDHVVALGLEEGSLPIGRWATERREETERIAEERRLFYVAATRARERLILARRTTHWTRGRGQQPAEPSRFLSEINGGKS
jgi:superfamily I DNA/RNA helicase